MDENTSMDEFFEGMSEDYQTEDTAEETTTDSELAEEFTDAVQEAEDDAVTEEKSDSTNEPAEAEKPTETSEDTQTYVLRVNHEDKVCTPEEYKAFAQKGADYDRVKTQLEQAKNDNSGLQSQIAEMQAVVDVVNELAQASNITLPELLKSFRKTRYTSQGYSDREADIAIERDDLLAKERTSQREQAPEQAQESGEDRAKREVAEFQSRFPDISITEELVNKLADDVHGGMSLTDAYIKMKDSEQAARIKELEAQLAAEKQNAENRQSSPGSLKDSGKKKAHDQYDDFFDQFF